MRESTPTIWIQPLKTAERHVGRSLHPLFEASVRFGILDVPHSLAFDLYKPIVNKL